MQTKAKTTKAEYMGEPSGKICKCGAEIQFHAYRSWSEGGGSATHVSEWCPAHLKAIALIMEDMPKTPYWKYQEKEQEVWFSTRRNHTDLDGHGPYYN